MKNKTDNGGGLVSVLFVLLFIASVVLNAILLVGCDTLDGGTRPRSENDGKNNANTSQQTHPSEADFLREIAARLGIGATSDKTPGDIAFDIKQRLDTRLTYRGTVFSEAGFEKASAAIRIPEDQETLKEYHDFIRKIAGKRIIVFE